MRLRFNIQPEGRPVLRLRAYAESREELDPLTMTSQANLLMAILATSGAPIDEPFILGGNIIGVYLEAVMPYSQSAASVLQRLGWKPL